MKLSKIHVVSGFKWALFVAASLLFLPPLLIGFLPVWADAKILAAQDKRLTELCKVPASLELSRWLYLYKFSGESASAEFNGEVINADCNKKFRVKLKKNASVWQITDVIIK